MTSQPLSFADIDESPATSGRLRLATVSAVIGFALTVTVILLKVFQVIVTPIVVRGAPPSFDAIESTIGAVALIAFVPMVVEIVMGHVALAGSQSSEVRRRVLATVGISVGYFYVFCLATDIALALLSVASEPAADHATFLQQLFYSLG
ncbi:MAG TPA: hypothetical protein VIJ11_00430 [Galbitalea sp.]